MDDLPSRGEQRHWPPPRRVLTEVILLGMLFFAYAGDLPPMVNEAHYLVKAKNFWQPEWCQNDLFAASGKAHTTFYCLFGWPVLFCSLEATAWIGRIVGWSILAFGLHRLSWALLTRRYASLGVAVVWIAGVEYGNLAGEWVVGGIEAKVPAYGLLLLALAELVRRHWDRVWILLGAASAFHVLTGGWSVVAAIVTWCCTEREREDRHRLFTPSLLVGGAIALLGLIPAIALTAGASSEDAAVAARVYSYYRLSHHLLPSELAVDWYIRHGILIAATLAVSRYYCWRYDTFRRIGWFTVAAVLIAFVGLVVGLLPPLVPDLTANVLRYYWFRLTDSIVPLMFALLVMRMVIDTHRSRRLFGIALLVLGVTLIGLSGYRRSRLGVPPSASYALLGLAGDASRETQQNAFRDWLAVCRWARASTPPDEVFLTPRHQQTFKWYAERAEVVNWKDVPQDSVSLRKWYQRFGEVFPQRLGSVRVTVRYAKLREYRQKFGCRYMIVDRRVVGPNLPLIQIYPTEAETNRTYAVYELPR